MKAQVCKKIWITTDHQHDLMTGSHHYYILK